VAWLFLIPLVAVALLFGLLALLWLADSGFSYVAWALNTLEEDLQAGVAGVREKLFRRAARKHVERRFAVAAGAAGTVDHDAVEATKQMPALRRLFDAAGRGRALLTPAPKVGRCRGRAVHLRGRIRTGVLRFAPAGSRARGRCDGHARTVSVPCRRRGSDGLPHRVAHRGGAGVQQLPVPAIPAGYGSLALPHGNHAQDRPKADN